MSVHVINPDQLALFTGTFPKRRHMDEIVGVPSIGRKRAEDQQYAVQMQQQQTWHESRYGRTNG